VKTRPVYFSWVLSPFPQLNHHEEHEEHEEEKHKIIIQLLKPQNSFIVFRYKQKILRVLRALRGSF
jgi:hypothetical protein